MSGNGAPAATAGERHRAVVLYTQRGLTVTKVAAELGRSYTAVYGWLCDVGVLPYARNAPPPDDAEKHHAVVLYARHGRTVGEVADELHRSYGAVRGWLKAAGVLRPRGPMPRRGTPGQPVGSGT